MLQYFFSENAKIKRTFVKKLMWLAPILVSFLSLFLTMDYFQVDAYNWWYTSIFPGILSLSCVFLNRVDGSMKNRATIALPVNLRKIWIAKVLVGVKNISFSCMIIFVIAQVGIYVFPIDSVSNIPMLDGLAGIIIIIITFMWQVPLCIFLVSKIGMFPTIILSVVINFSLGLVAAIEKYWWMSPFSYPARLMCPILKILPNGMLAEPGNPTFAPELLDYSVIPLGIIISIMLFLVFTYLTAKWYERQEAI